MSFLSSTGIFKSRWGTGAKSASISTQFGRNPWKDWRYVFLGFIILTIVLIGLNVYVYERIDKGDIFLAEETVSPTNGVLNREKLQKTVQFFEGKKGKTQSLRANPPRYFDPSL